MQAGTCCEHEVDIVGKSQVAVGPATNRDGGMVVLEGVLQDLYLVDVEQD